jgi:3-phosphoshikimate 1-carboxyvinyltransferase
MTIDAMKSFGVNAEWKSETEIYIKGNQQYKSQTLTVEGDYSNAAFIEAFNLLGSDVEVKNLDDDSLQGDKIYKKYFSELSSGAPILDVSNCPDLAPVLMTIAAMKNGATLTGTKRLEIKESDRAEAMKDELSKFGADITVNEDSVIIRKTDLYTPTEKLVSHNDHRVVMALSVAASVFGGEIEGTEAVKKSYPDFFSDLKKLGAETELIR